MFFLDNTKKSDIVTDIVIARIENESGAWILVQVTSNGECTLKSTNSNQVRVIYASNLIEYLKGVIKWKKA